MSLARLHVHLTHTYNCHLYVFVRATPCCLYKRLQNVVKWHLSLFWSKSHFHLRVEWFELLTRVLTRQATSSPKQKLFCAMILCCMSVSRLWCILFRFSWECAEQSNDIVVGCQIGRAANKITDHWLSKFWIVTLIVVLLRISTFRTWHSYILVRDKIVNAYSTKKIVFSFFFIFNCRKNRLQHFVSDRWRDKNHLWSRREKKTYFFIFCYKHDYCLPIRFAF